MGISNHCAVVCEILDSRTQETISRNEKVSLSSDFVQSNQMVSQILAMVSEDRNVKTILGQMLGAAGASVKVTPSIYLCEPHEHLSYWQLQKRCIAMDKTLLGYQGHIGNEETVINPKDKEVAKYWDGIDVIFMEGHSELDHNEKTEEILEALAKRHSYSNLDQAAGALEDAVQAGPVNTHTVMEADDSLLEMLESMNARIGSLTSTVDTLANRVEGMTGQSDQPFLMIPQRVRTQMNERIGHLHTNVTSIQTRVDALANQAQSPILMVPQFSQKK